MNPFSQSLQEWQMFFATVATVSATLTGLLFVSLSLNRDRLRDEQRLFTLGIARNTFGDFLYVLMIALVFLVPHQVPIGLAVALIALGISSGLGVLIREAHQSRRTQNGWADVWLILRRIGLPSIASLGLLAVAIEIAFQHYVAIFGLVGVIAALLVTACWNAWLLLVEK